MGSREARRPLRLAGPVPAARASRIPSVNASVANWLAAAEPAVHRSAYESTASQYSENSAASVAS